MIRNRGIFVLATCVAAVLAQYEIWDVWQTTWNRDNLYSNISPTTPIQFTSPGAIGSADIEVDDTTIYQPVLGFGGALTDSSAELLSGLKSANEANYNALLQALFVTTDGSQSAGLNFVRIPVGASDFSASAYSYDDSSGDTSLTSFSVDDAPSYLFSTLSDIVAVNSGIKILLTPWSPPGWMKDSGTMDGGSLTTSLVNTYVNYLLKTVQGFTDKGFTIFAVSIQNEPENSDSTYPTCSMPVVVMAQIGEALRTLLDDNSLSSVRLIGYDHNWDDASGYPVQLMEAAESSFDGVAFHCYAGDVSDQLEFQSAYPNKNIYFTECTSEFDSDWWSNIKWFMDNLFIGAISDYAQSALMWNLALDESGDPKLPGTDSCGGAGCRGIVTIYSNATYMLNEEYYSMAQASRAVMPKDSGGPWGQRIGVTVGGELSWALIVGAYVTGRLSSSDWLRYSLVVMNWDDSADTTWNPVDVQATIEFRDTQATYTFPVGVTTLWWFAPNETSFDGPRTTSGTDEEKVQASFDPEGLEFYAEYGGIPGGGAGSGAQQVLGGVFRRERNS